MVGKWRSRFRKARLEGLYDEPRSGVPRILGNSVGNSVGIVAKHYAKWDQSRQDRIDGLMREVQKQASPGLRRVK
jgi:hypothetical protein